MSQHQKLANPYRTLGVKRDAKDEDIRAAYFDAVRTHPPDGDPDGFERIRTAYEWLKSPEQRQAAEALTLRDETEDLGKLPLPDPPEPLDPAQLVARAFAEHLLSELDV
ncbi:MAG: DnaJ domain-containing protein [Planctomycetota bacterium]